MSNRYIGGYACVKVLEQGKITFKRLDQVMPFDRLYLGENEYEEVSGVKYYPADYTCMCVVDWESKYPIFVSTFVQRTESTLHRDDPGISYEEYWKRIRMGKQLLRKITTEKRVKIPIYSVEEKEVLQVVTEEKEFPFKKNYGDDYRKNIYFSIRVKEEFKKDKQFLGLEDN